MGSSTLALKSSKKGSAAGPESLESPRREEGSMSVREILMEADQEERRKLLFA
jgi:hypothetical protein